MGVAVIGAGAIGSLVAGYLKLKGEDVYLVGRPDTVKAIREGGIRISGVRGDFKVKVDIFDMLVTKPDVLILATKTQDVNQALRENLSLLKDTIILTTQNGVQSDKIVSKVLPKENIVSSVIMFGATYLAPGMVVHNFEGSWILGSIFDHGANAHTIPLSLLLDKVFSTVISEDILGMKYLKVFVNANNCIPAVLGISMQEAFSDPEISRISIGLWREGFDIVDNLGIKLTSLPGFPVENVTKLLALPAQQAAGLFSGIMVKLSKDPLYGSILQSIKRGKESEIDYLNGEFVRLAEENELNADLNKKMVDLVHQVEQTGKFFSKSELLTLTKGLFN